MKKVILVSALIICSISYGQDIKHATSKGKYLELTIKMPEASQIVYETPANALKPNLIKINPSVSLQIANEDNPLTRRIGAIEILPAPIIKKED
jgi:hypothetical protein